MAWRAPRYSFEHWPRTAGAAAISSANSFSTTQTKDHLIDNRGGSLTTFAASASDHYIQFDLSGLAAYQATRLWIPSGHNMSGWDIRVRAADDASITTSVTTLIDPTVAYTEGGAGGLSVPSGALDFIFTANTQDYVRIDWPNETNINPEIGELLLTRALTLSRGIEKGWRHDVITNVDLQSLKGGAQAALVTGANQQQMEFSYRAVSSAGDLSIWDQIEAIGRSAPVLVDPPYDDNSAVWCYLQRFSGTQDPAVPSASATTQRQIRVEWLEHVL